MNYIFRLFFSFSLGVFLATMLIFFLPMYPKMFLKNEGLYVKYVDIVTPFFRSFTPKATEVLKGVKLKATFIDKDNSFIIIEKNKKVKFINLNSVFNGYKLVKIEPFRAIFKKDNKFYKIELQKLKVEDSDESGYLYINKKTFTTYKKDLNKIWSEIAIDKVKEGYKIKYIKNGSIFSKIGLKRGDIIISVNGIRLKNDADAFRAYKSVRDWVEIEIKRNNQIKVLRYEIK